MTESFDPEASQSEEVLGISELANILSLLNSKTRIKILLVLSEGSKTVGQVVKSVDESQSLVSQQLKIFRDEGLVMMEKVLENKRLHRNMLTKKGAMVAEFIRAQAEQLSKQ